MDQDAVPVVSRRVVLRGALAAPAIFGLGALLGCRGRRGDVPPIPPAAGGETPLADIGGVPEWWPQFRHRVAMGERVGVVVRIPAASATRRAFGTTLVDLVDRGTFDERLLFLGAAVACVTDGQLRAVLPTVGDVGLVLVDAQLAPFASAPLPVDVASNRERTSAALTDLVYGTDGARLADRAAKARAALPSDELRLAYDRLATKEDRGTVANSLSLFGPMIAAERRGASSPARRAVIDGILAETVGLTGWSPAGRFDLHPLGNLPIGLVAESEGGGCGGMRGAKRDGPVVACGMAMPTPGSFRFVRFLVDRPA